MRISEIYVSRQGEGRLTGTPSVFVRTTGCNLRCDFCDTPFTSWQPSGDSRSLRSIINEVQRLSESGVGPVQHVVLTGGEPMLSRDVVALCELLSDFHITIETAGTCDRNVRCDLMSISPKLSNSTPSFSRAGGWRERHEGLRFRPNVVRRLIEKYDYQLKFVVDRTEDVAEILDYLGLIETVDPTRVLLMPQGIHPDELERRAQWLIPLCQRYGFSYCPRQHIFWYGNQRGT